jgi:hypothetical protein
MAAVDGCAPCLPSLVSQEKKKRRKEEKKKRSRDSSILHPKIFSPRKNVYDFLGHGEFLGPGPK